MPDYALALKNYQEGKDINAPTTATGGGGITFKTPKIQERFAQISPDLQNAVQSFPGELTITSSLRTKEENKKVGGVPNSFHISGNAVDIRTSGKSKDELAQITNHFKNQGLQVIDEGDHLHIEPLGTGKQAKPPPKASALSSTPNLADALAQYRQEKGLPPLQQEEEIAQPVKAPQAQVTDVPQEPGSPSIGTDIANVSRSQKQQASDLLRQIELSEMPDYEKGPIINALTNVLAQPVPGETFLGNVSEGGETLQRVITNTLTGGLGEKAAGAGKGTADALINALGGETKHGDIGLFDRISQNITENNRAFRELQERNPKSSFVGSVVGTTLGPSNLIPGKGILSTIGKGALEGVQSELGTGGDVFDALLGGGFGAGTAGVLSGAGKGLSKIGKFGFRKALGNKKGVEDVMDYLGVWDTRTRETIRKKAGSLLQTSEQEVQDVLERNVKKAVPLPENLTPGDLKDLADKFLTNEDMATALRLEKIANSVTDSGSLNPVDADFLNQLYGGLARTDSGVKGTVKAKVYEEYRKNLRKGVAESLAPSDKKIYEGLKKKRQALGGAVKQAGKQGSSLNAFDLLNAYLSGGASLGYTAVKSYPMVGATLNKTGKALENDAIRRILTQLGLEAF